MSKPLVAILLVSAVLTACASTSETKPAVCDGKHRRPANPYGSVLPTAPLPGAGAVQKSTDAKPPAAIGQLSRLDPQSTQPCGRPS